MFPGHAVTQTQEMFRSIVAACSEGFTEIVKFLTTAMDKTDVFVIADGRSEVARTEIRELLASLVGGDGSLSFRWFMT